MKALGVVLFYVILMPVVLMVGAILLSLFFAILIKILILVLFYGAIGAIFLALIFE